MRTINNFTDETRFMFMEDNYWKCWNCGSNHANCGHHIFGRGHAEGCEKSPLNFAPLNNHECHIPIHGQITTDEGKRKLFTLTLNYLLGRGYRLTEQDEEFLSKYNNEITRLKLQL